MSVNQNVYKRARRVLEIATRMAEALKKERNSWEARSRIEEIQLHDGYADGSDAGKAGIIATGNWNTVDTWDEASKSRVLISDLPKRVGDIFEKMGIEIEWSDTTSTCDQCYKLIRTEPDCWSWKPNFVVGDGSITCGACIEEDPDDYLESLEGNDEECLSLDIDLAARGYVKLNEDSYESGWFPGQNNDPKRVAKQLRDKKIERFIFVKDENSQFYSKWSVWVWGEPSECESCHAKEYEDNLVREMTWSAEDKVFHCEECGHANMPTVPSIE